MHRFFYRRLLLSEITDSTHSSQQGTRIHLPSRSILEALLQLCSKLYTVSPALTGLYCRKWTTNKYRSVANSGEIQNPAINLSNSSNLSGGNPRCSPISKEAISVWKNIHTCHVGFFSTEIHSCLLSFVFWQAVYMIHACYFDMVFN